MNQVEKKYSPTDFIVIFLAMAMFVIAAFLTALFVTILQSNGFNIRDFIANHGGLNWLVFGLGYLAFALYKFKTRQQYWYGIAEISFGFYCLVAVAARLGKTVVATGIDPFSIIGELSAVYLIIRGLSNVSEGYAKPFRWKKFVVKYSRP
jgi:hypothetical protein